MITTPHSGCAIMNKYQQKLGNSTATSYHLGARPWNLSIVFLMQNTRTAIITIKRSMVHPLLSKSDIRQSHATL